MVIKKIILPIVLSFVIVLSGFTLFGCGEKETKEKSYELISSTMENIKNDTTLFENKTTNGLNSDFSIKDIGFKTSNDSDLSGYEYYVTVLAGGLEFINDYYEKLNTTQGVVKNVALNDAVKAMSKSYDNVKAEHDELMKASDNSNLHYDVYNGYFYNYKITVSNFINKVYDYAFSLANYLDKYLNLTANVGKETMSQEQFNFYLDYEYLKIYNDFKILYMDSMKGADLDVTYVDNIIYTQFNILAKSEKTTDLVIPQKPNPDETKPGESEENQVEKIEVSEENDEIENSDKEEEIQKQKVEKMKSLITIFKHLAENRKDVKEAMKKFSIYKFVEVYGQDIVAYTKDSENAEKYYNKINDYFIDEYSTLNLLLNKLEKEVVAKGN